MSAVHPFPERPRTLAEIGANPRVGDVLRIREGDYSVELRVEHVANGIVRFARTVTGCFVDALMFKALCAEPGAEVGDE